MALFGAMFAARTDVYAVRWENARTGKAGWLPAVRGGWRKGVPHAEREYLPLTAELLASHLSGEVHAGLYPLLDGDRCWWLAADFDGPAAMLDALAYLKAARSLAVPAALEVSRSGVGAHAWVFFTGPVPAETARRLGADLLREAMALRGQMDLASYDRLFPSQDVLPAGGVGNLIAAPLRAQISYNSSHGNQALPMLLAAARRFEPLDGNLARGIYLDALSAALFAGRLATGPGPGLRRVAQAAREALPPQAPSKADLLLEGMAVLYTDGYEASAPLLHRAVQAFGREDLTLDEAFHSAWVAAVAAVDLWDDVHWDILSQRHLDVVRQAGALSLLPLALASRAIFDIHSGNLAAAAALVGESHWVAEVTGGENTLTPIPEAWLAAMRGHEKQAEQLIQDTLNAATALGQGVGLNMMYAARASLCNGLGRYEDALAAAREAATDPLELGPTKWALAELVEAGVRSGNPDAAASAFEQLSAMTRASGTELALGIEAARRALLRDDDTAEELYQEAIERLGHTRIRVELARAQLLYGEWLRREGRRADARAQLRTAYEALAAMGVEAFADRARHELAATGETVRKRAVETGGELTAQEAHIARLAAEGLTSPEIAAALYLSPRTVEWHLRKIYAKLGVSTRRQLRRLPHAD